MLDGSTWLSLEATPVRDAPVLTVDPAPGGPTVGPPHDRLTPDTADPAPDAVVDADPDDPADPAAGDPPEAPPADEPVHDGLRAGVDGVAVVVEEVGGVDVAAGGTVAMGVGVVVAGGMVGVVGVDVAGGVGVGDATGTGVVVVVVATGTVVAGVVDDASPDGLTGVVEKPGAA
jgi:hypothetical protein